MFAHMTTKQYKARVLKHQNKPREAAIAAESARKMDLADRSANAKAAKYALRANDVDGAVEIMNLFSRPDGPDYYADDPKNPIPHHVNNLYEMQCSWFQIEAGNACLRTNQILRAFKFFSSVHDHFDMFEDDQFDFHSYCLRKSTLNAYVSALRLEDEIRSHDFYQKAAIGMLKCYVRMSDENIDVEQHVEASNGAPKKKDDDDDDREDSDEDDEEEGKTTTLADDMKSAGRGRRNKDWWTVDNDPHGLFRFQKENKDPLKHAKEMIGKLTKNVKQNKDAADAVVRVLMRTGDVDEALKVAENAGIEEYAPALNAETKIVRGDDVSKWKI